MLTDSHTIYNEFPELTDKIHVLKVENHHFKKLYDEYHEINKEIHGIESGAEFVVDEVLTQMRKTRLHLKDELYQLLTQ